MEIPAETMARTDAVNTQRPVRDMENLSNNCKLQIADFKFQLTVFPICNLQFEICNPSLSIPADMKTQLAVLGSRSGQQGTAVAAGIPGEDPVFPRQPAVQMGNLARRDLGQVDLGEDQ